MLWEGRPLNEIREADIRAILESGLEEHLQLEYKSALYEANDRGKREFLQDVCMFANTSGGLLLIGIPERRDDQQQPTGIPDPNGLLGLEIPNPALVLGAYDASVTASIEERLALESASIELANGRRVLAFRIPNSTRKPHSVQHQGHIYFPARRERHRYALSVREIKELAMRTLSRLENAERTLEAAFLSVPRTGQFPYVMVGLIPVFSDDFLVDVRKKDVVDALAKFSRTDESEWRPSTYTFHGIERREKLREYVVALGRNGLLTASQQLPMYQGATQGNQDTFVITAIDSILRRFALKARVACEAGGVGPPYLLGMMLRTQKPLVGIYGGPDGLPYNADAVLPPGDYRFPYMQMDDVSNPDRIIRPLCDQAHQAFGLECSPSFNAEGLWSARHT